MKHLENDMSKKNPKSPLMRGRGLKQEIAVSEETNPRRPSCGGVD